MTHRDTRPITFTYAPVAFMWVVTPHNLFLYSEPPYPGTPFLFAQAIFEPNLFPYKYSNILKPSHSSYLSAYEDGTECSETSAYKIQTSGNYPEESIQYSSLVFHSSDCYNRFICSVISRLALLHTVDSGLAICRSLFKKYFKILKGCVITSNYESEHA
jgi:hypothetical protein